MAISVLPLLCSCAESGYRKQIEPVKFSEVRINDSFWGSKLQAHKDVTLNVCIDQIENQTGRMKNFENAAIKEGAHSGIFFDDSDVYKALEGLSYSLINHPDPALEQKCGEWVEKISAAQEADGYINTYYTLTGLEDRWKGMQMHEMYCAGHLIEAAVAYYDATGKRKLLDVSENMVNHMMSVFGPGKRDWVPGHEEIELALVKLYEVTGKKEYLDFSEWLLSERGKGLGVKYKDGEYIPWSRTNNQDLVPVKEMKDAYGHAVRAMYLYCGMADVASHTRDTAAISVLERLYDVVVGSKMYITGGIGSHHGTESFGEPYFLPNHDAYCETCAAVGMVFWNWRMNQMTGDAKYIDVMERAMFNGVISGMSLKGDKFFYVNPLESYGDHHRQEWYGCACCPSQICRFIPSVGNYIYGLSEDALVVNSFIGNESEYMSMTTDYPWDGRIVMKVGPKGAKQKNINIRIPGWCNSWKLTVRGEAYSPAVAKGYARIPGGFKEGDIIELYLDMPIEVISADPRVKDDHNKRAVQRGPVVYCLEEEDNPQIDAATLSAYEELSATYDPELLGGIIKIDSDNLHFVPYYSWDNRSAGKMKVWVNFTD